MIKFLMFPKMQNICTSATFLLKIYLTPPWFIFEFSHCTMIVVGLNILIDEEVKANFPKINIS